jgi:hypothetical protein
MVAATAACGLFVGYPYTAVWGAPLSCLQSRRVGRSYRKKVMNFACELGTDESCSDTQLIE